MSKPLCLVVGNLALENGLGDAMHPTLILKSQRRSTDCREYRVFVDQQNNRV
ncbi:hypothetical protein LCGC14_0651210 [marine sediment metagenome]|uniref:Uncharacterized protein n=1 Tax=marine sediment metagenome TaxID=412755 RepID=A0A0F9RG21_9ZZZZ